MKNSRLYALCVAKELPDGRKSFYRVSNGSYQKKSAVRFFQDALLFGAFNAIFVELRPVREQFSETAPGLGALAQIAESSK